MLKLCELSHISFRFEDKHIEALEQKQMFNIHYVDAIFRVAVEASFSRSYFMRRSLCGLWYGESTERIASVCKTK